MPIDWNSTDDLLALWSRCAENAAADRADISFGHWTRDLDVRASLDRIAGLSDEQARRLRTADELFLTSTVPASNADMLTGDDFWWSRLPRHRDRMADALAKYGIAALE